MTLSEERLIEIARDQYRKESLDGTADPGVNGFTFATDCRLKCREGHKYSKKRLFSRQRDASGRKKMYNPDYVPLKRLRTIDLLWIVPIITLACLRKVFV